MIKKQENLLLRYFLLNKYWPQYLIIFGLVLLISLLFPKGESLRYVYQLNDITREPIIAPFTFPILKSQQKLKKDLDEKRESIPSVFNRNESIVIEQSRRLDDFFIMINKIHNSKLRFTESERLVYERRYHKQYKKAHSEFISDSTNLSIIKTEFLKLYPFTLEKKTWEPYLSTSKDSLELKNIENYSNGLIQICRNRWTEGIYDIPLKDIASKQVAVNQGRVPDLTSPNQFNDLESAWIKSKKELNSLFKEDKRLRDLGNDIIVEFLKPNLLYDKETTLRRQKESLDRVPRSQGVVLKNELIVDANMRITEGILLKLNSLSVAISKEGDGEGVFKGIQSILGRIILLSALVSLFFAFLIVYRISIFNDWRMVLLISLVFFLQVAVTNIVVIQLELSEYLIPITMGTMTLTILFDARMGFMATTSFAMLMGIMMGQNIDLVIVSLFTGTVAIYSIRQLRKRSQLFMSMFALMGASIFVIIGIGLFKDNSWAIMFRDMQFLVLNSILAPILTYGLIGLFEMVFEVTTDLTLIELLDYDHPLLKEAQREINGTFNHSIVVGNLAESCAHAIGAHSLLCRVGAYYHDIGKMAKSEYFIENQYGGHNRHDDLTHTMSAKIIRSHVNEGLRLANEYGLPKIVSDFIPMHHGTNRIEYFYRLAFKDAEEKGLKIDESAYRYPGPKPNTKETGILMICDAVEGAVRSLKEPDIFKIEVMINNIIAERIKDGQLDECPLTLDELNKIVGQVDGNTGMLPVLRGIYHIRVEYPDNYKNKTKK